MVKDKEDSVWEKSLPWLIKILSELRVDQYPEPYFKDKGGTMKVKDLGVGWGGREEG